MVIEHTQAINCIALSLNHKSLRTKALVLELLAAICLVKGGHPIILNAFDNFKAVCGEQYRFLTLMEYFKDLTEYNIDFMVRFCGILKYKMIIIDRNATVDCAYCAHLYKF